MDDDTFGELMKSVKQADELIREHRDGRQAN
jgi:hypothetical protein